MLALGFASEQVMTPLMDRVRGTSVCKQLKLALFLYILVATAPVDVSYP